MCTALDSWWWTERLSKTRRVLFQKYIWEISAFRLASSQQNLYDIYLLLCVQCYTPDDGQRNCPKHVEFYSKNKFEKLVHLVGFIIRIYHDARTSECQLHTPSSLSAGTHRTGGWLVPRASLDAFKMRKISCICWESNHVGHKVCISLSYFIYLNTDVLWYALRLINVVVWHETF